MGHWCKCLFNRKLSFDVGRIATSKNFGNFQKDIFLSFFAMQFVAT
jgi:hypothetical protein